MPIVWPGSGKRGGGGGQVGVPHSISCSSTQGAPHPKNNPLQYSPDPRGDTWVHISEKGVQRPPTDNKVLIVPKKVVQDPPQYTCIPAVPKRGGPRAPPRHLGPCCPEEWSPRAPKDTQVPSAPQKWGLRRSLEV